MTNRTEQEIFDELATVCTSPGYAHAIALFSYRDNIVSYKDEVRAADYARLFSWDRLIRTEISTLIGLMARKPIDFTLPPQTEIQAYLERTDKLLRELHDALNRPGMEAIRAALESGTRDVNPFRSAITLREPIFYGAESAYPSQYADLASRKYARDISWLQANKGFSAEDAKRVLVGIRDFLNDKLFQTLKSLKTVPREDWTVLEGFKFRASDISQVSGLDLDKVEAVLNAFTFPSDGNPTFTSLSEFNATNAYPILRAPDGGYVLFQYLSLAEAIYESPFYWLIADKNYRETASKNRGSFVEDFTTERLRRVFGEQRVIRNVDVWETKGRKTKLGEIDVLVLFGNRAIVVQAKSKKLTLEARKGNDLQLQADFKGAVQDSCDQAYSCSNALLTGTAILTDASSNEIVTPTRIKVVHPVCVVSDHYPALSFQAQQFLKSTASEQVAAPLVCDVFFVDVVTEFLETPLRLLSYLELRAMAGDKIIISHETTALGYHLKRNLWMGEYDGMSLHDDLSADVDIAMMARREGIPGKTTPPGILTALRGTTVGRIVEEIEKRSDVAPLEFGLELLKLSGEAAQDLSRAIDKIVSLAADGKEHNFTINIAEGRSGITVHCNSLPDLTAAEKLRRYCELRKYAQRASLWFGIVVSPRNGAVRFGTVLDYPWQKNEEMDAAVGTMQKPRPPETLRTFAKSRSSRIKVGRNAPCPCGSGLKYKKCHLDQN